MSQLLTPEEDRLLIEKAERLASQWSTPGKEIDGSIVAVAYRFLQDRPTPEMLSVFLQALPTTPGLLRSAGARPQVERFARELRALVDGARSRFPEDAGRQQRYLARLLGWTRRLMG